MSPYTIDYFIEKFTLIPTKDIGVGRLYFQCALFHCGVRDNCGSYTHTVEADSLIKLFCQLPKRYQFIRNDEQDGYFGPVTNVNDGSNKVFDQDTAKKRILAALNYLKHLDKHDSNI